MAEADLQRQALDELHGCMIRRDGPACKVRKEFLEVALRALSEALNPEHDSSWISWRGGGCPVPLEARVDVKWNNGAVSRGVVARTLAEGDVNLWRSRAKNCHIAAYRISEA